MQSQGLGKAPGSSRCQQAQDPIFLYPTSSWLDRIYPGETRQHLVLSAFIGVVLPQYKLSVIEFWVPLHNGLIFGTSAAEAQRKAD